MFKYLFYRYYHHFKKNEYKDTARLSASIALAMTQFLLILCILLILRMFIDMSGFFDKCSRLVTLVFLVMVFLFIFLNNKTFGNEIEKMEQTFKDYPANRWLKMWIIIVVNLLLLLLPFIIGAVIR